MDVDEDGVTTSPGGILSRVTSTRHEEEAEAPIRETLHKATTSSRGEEYCLTDIIEWMLAEGEMSDLNATIIKQPSSTSRSFELIHFQQTAREVAGAKTRREGAERDQEFLRFILEELEGMQRRVGELRFAVAAMTTLVKEKLDHG